VIDTKHDGLTAGAGALLAPSPEREAEALLDLLDVVHDHGTAEARAIRADILDAVASFRERRDRGGDAGLLARETAARLAALEARASETSAKSLRKVRDRVVGDSRRLGTASATGQAVRHIAESLGVLAEAFDQAARAARLGDAALRERARALVLQACRLLPAPAGEG